MVAGAILAATGATPEHWLADLLRGVHLPEEALHLWGADIDLRMVLAGIGLLLIAGDISWRRTRPVAAVESVRVAEPAPAAEPVPAAGAVPPDSGLALPDKPSIAVLAFDNLSGDPAQEYFSDGMAEDIIMQLSRGHALFVIARGSSFTYRGRAVDVKQVGRELGVRYVLEGSVRRAGERVRINAQLVESETGNHIWAERYDRSLADVFAVQDEISAAVAAAIGPAVADAEMQRAMRRPPKSIGAWELYQRGMWHLAKLDPTANDEARGLFERAIELDPMFAAAYAGLSRIYSMAGTVYMTMPLNEAMRSQTLAARKAVQCDPGDADAQAMLAGALFHEGEMDNALMTARQALAINPSCVWAHRVMGAVLIFAGRTAEGRQAMDVSVRLSPRDAGNAPVHGIAAVSYYFLITHEPQPI
jgi:adenylate cyclase